MTMQKPIVFVVPPIPPELRQALTERFELAEHVRGQKKPEQRVLVITSMGGADAALMDEFPDLKLLACNGTGLERIDLSEAARRGIIVRNTPDEVTDDTAEYAIGLIYAVKRRMVEADRFVRAGRWEKDRMMPSRRVAGQRIGIVGLGKIGSKIAQRAAAIGMTVSYTGPRRKPQVPYTYVENIRELADAVDILVLSVPGGPATQRLVGMDVLRALGPEGVLINVSRGEVVDEEALITALQNKIIAGAGLDVFENEPRIDKRFFELENVVLAPHYATVTLDTRYAIAHTLRDAISDFLAGRPVPNAAAMAQA
jgi:lactate dehydrogenase-like 2-hydroxyacid dehydrogenase